MAVKMFASGLL